MANLNVPKCVLFTPAHEERSEESSSAVIKNTKFYEVITTCQEMQVQEQHENRLKDLRSELEYLKQTAWQYEGVEKSPLGMKANAYYKRTFHWYSGRRINPSTHYQN
ncbi:hypothetical protein D910_06607 [Dendroctonus ponderosae]